MRRTTALLMALTLACLGVGIAIVAIGRSPDRLTEDTGRLATLLADGHYSTVAGLVAPTERKSLSSQRLQAAWLAALNSVGSLQSVTHTYTVRDASTRGELEVLSFDQGTGTFAATRTPAGITAMWLLAGTSTDATAASLARRYAQALVAGQTADLVGDFNDTMRAAVTSEALSTTVKLATAHFSGTPRVGAQVAISHDPYVTVETYLLYDNGFLRVEMTLDSTHRIVGLYLRPI